MKHRIENLHWVDTKINERQIKSKSNCPTREKRTDNDYGKAKREDPLRIGL